MFVNLTCCLYASFHWLLCPRLGRGLLIGAADDNPARQRSERDPQLCQGPEGGPPAGPGEQRNPLLGPPRTKEIIRAIVSVRPAATRF